MLEQVRWEEICERYGTTSSASVRFPADLGGPCLVIGVVFRSVGCRRGKYSITLLQLWPYLKKHGVSHRITVNWPYMWQSDRAYNRRILNHSFDLQQWGLKLPPSSPAEKNYHFQSHCSSFSFNRLYLSRQLIAQYFTITKEPWGNLKTNLWIKYWLLKSEVCIQKS